MSRPAPRPATTKTVHSTRRGFHPVAGALPPQPTSTTTYTHDPTRSGKIFLAYEGFRTHMTDEGWQLQEGMREAGYRLWGKRYEGDESNVGKILDKATKEFGSPPGVAIIQDKREWDPTQSGCFDKGCPFHHCEMLGRDPGTFRLTVCKDAHHNPPYHKEFADEFGCHAWITYYHPDAVCRLAPYVRRQHLVRTWHSVNPDKVPPYTPDDRRTCLLSGSHSKQYYPLRHRLFNNAAYLPVEVRHHPGYHDKGVDTDNFLFALSHYKIAICTASNLGYALRKLIEATACGCRVITDLPANDPLPEIDGNLVRVDPNIKLHNMANLIKTLAAEYDPAVQEAFAKKAVAFYDYARRGRELTAAIDALRENYQA